jgi:hypothetical protein
MTVGGYRLKSANKLWAHGFLTVAFFIIHWLQRQIPKIAQFCCKPKCMSELTPQDLTTKVKELETRLAASLDAIAHLVKAVEYLRANDSQGIFDLDLAKHALNEAGYEDETLKEALYGQNESEPD